MRRDENLGRSKTTARVSFVSPVKNHHGRSTSHSRRESGSSTSHSRRGPGRSSSNSRRGLGRSTPQSRGGPGRSTSKGRREPGRSSSNSRKEPGRSRSGVRLQESRIDVVDVTSSSRYLLVTYTIMIWSNQVLVSSEQLCSVWSTISDRIVFSRCSTSSSNYSPLENRTSRVTEHSFTLRADWAGRYSEERSRSRSRRRQRNQVIATM